MYSLNNWNNWNKSCGNLLPVFRLPYRNSRIKPGWNGMDRYDCSSLAPRSRNGSQLKDWMNDWRARDWAT